MRIPGIAAVAISAALMGASPSWAQSSGPVLFPGASQTIERSGAPPYLEGWWGIGASNTYFGGWVGAVVALNANRNVWDSGFVLRGEASVGQYDHTAINASDVWTHGASWMFGYRQKIGDGSLTGYIGANYETHQNNDPFASIRGTEFGWKGLIEYSTLITPNMSLYGSGSYSTAFETLVLFGRVGFQVMPTIWIGPEASYFRNEAPYKEARYGGFIRFDEALWGSSLTLSGGWLNPLKSTDDDGWYAALNIGFALR